MNYINMLLPVTRRCLSIVLCCIAICCIVLTGCSQKLPYPAAKLAGKVTIDGVPIPKGKITFYPKDDTKGPTCGATIEDGNYVCEAVPKGKLRVQVLATRDTGKKELYMGIMMPILANIIPEKERAGREIEVVGDNSSQDFQLTAK